MGSVVLFHPSNSAHPPASPIYYARLATSLGRHLTEEAIGLSGVQSVTDKANLELPCMVTYTCHACPHPSLAVYFGESGPDFLSLPCLLLSRFQQAASRKL